MINLSDGFLPFSKSQAFVPGDVVKHRKYGYRGVIVEIDPSCKAPDEWYQSNQTQPSKDQPWHHVLVDGVQQVTYAALSNLELDGTGEPVVHGMLNLFFSGYDQKARRYQRNKVPWDPGKPPEAPPSLPPPDFTPPPPPT